MSVEHTLVLQSYQSAKDYPETLRGIRYKNPKTGKCLRFITKDTALRALSVCAYCKARWQVDLFFRSNKQHLRVKAFFRTTEKAVKSQIWFAVLVYVLVAIIRKLCNLSRRQYEVLHVLSLNRFEKIQLNMVLSRSDEAPKFAQSTNCSCSVDFGTAPIQADLAYANY